MLREQLAVTLGLQQVAAVPENIYHACIHPPTLQLLQQDVVSNFERSFTAFSTVDTHSRAASYRELAVITIAFAAAQRKGPGHWVRVKNLIGAEALCAALGVAFNADISINTIRATTRSTSTKSNTSTRRTGTVDPATTHRSKLQPDSVNESSLSRVTPTSIYFEYDTSGEVAIGVCEAGQPIRDYIVPEGGARRPSRNSMLCSEILALARKTLDGHLELSWICKGALAAYTLRNLAQEMVETLEKHRNGTCGAMSGNIIDKWTEAFVRETGGTQEERKMMHKLLVIAAIPDITQQHFVSEVKLLTGPAFVVMVSKAFVNSSALTSIDDTLVVSFFEALFGQSYTGLELSLDSLDSFIFGSKLRLLIPKLFRILPAFNIPVTAHRDFSVCCSVVQSGAYVLMPRILAEGQISGIDSSPFIMFPGWLAKNGVPVDGFFYDEQHDNLQMDATRPNARVPSDASESDVIDYVYEESDFGYKFWTVEAGHRLNLDNLIEGILFMHAVDDSFDGTAEITTWQCVAPHHTVSRTNRVKTAYLAYGNVAGRRLALSRVGDALNIAVVHFGKDYKGALAYAEKNGCNIVIL